MRRFPAVVALALTVLAGPAAAGPAAPGPVVLKSRVTVEGPVVRLGDLFDGLGERGATVVARAPEPGRRVEVGARWLGAVAQAYTLPWRPESRFDKTVIERASQVIDSRRIEDEMRRALAQRGVSGNIDLVLDNPSLRLHLPTDAEATLVVTSLSHDPGTGRFAAHIVAPAEGAPLARARVSGRAVKMTEVPVLTRRVEPGEVIGRQDIEWISVRADRLGRSIVAEAAKLVGKSPRRPIRAGQIILSADVREPILVTKNSLVTIKLATARMVLTAQGRALDQGARGAVVRVMNTKSNKIINAAVVESGLVRVDPTALNGMSRETQK